MAKILIHESTDATACFRQLNSGNKCLIICIWVNRIASDLRNIKSVDAEQQVYQYTALGNMTTLTWWVRSVKTTVSLYKTRDECNTYREIGLLSVPEKVYGRVLNECDEANCNSVSDQQ